MIYWGERLFFPETSSSLTSLSWLSALAVGTREAWSARWALLSLGSRGASSTWFSRWSGHCSNWHGGLDGDLVQDGVIAGQVACRGQEGFEKRFHNEVFWVFLFVSLIANWIAGNNLWDEKRSSGASGGRMRAFSAKKSYRMMSLICK